MAWADLDRRDADATLALVDEIRRVATLDAYADAVMSGLFDLIDCQDVSYNEIDPSARRVAWRTLPDQGELMAEFAPTFERLMQQNPLIHHYDLTGDTRALMWSDFMPVEQLRQTELHREMFSKLGIDHQMAVTLPAAPGIIVGVAVNSPSPFTERDRAIMNTLRPYLSHTYRSIQLGDELSTVRARLRDGGWVAALAAPDGEVTHVGDEAAAALDELDVVVEPGRPLPDRLREHFLPGVGGYRPDQPAVPSTATRLSDEGDGVDGWFVPGPVEPHVVLVQTGGDRERARLVAAGLSPRQVEVALHLAQGGTNRTIAGRMGIAEGTVRKHLESVYRALSVNDRASAIAVIKGW